MDANKNSYKQILKATSLFGGVQFINMFGSIIKTKVAAIFIGVAGVGIFGILTSTLNFIQTLTRCGLDLTAVKEIASVNTSDVPKKIGLINQLALFTGILGLLVVVIMSPWLSQIAFDNKTYTLFFITVSVAALFNQLSVGNMAILQGLKALKRLAKVITLSSLISLLPTICIYYFFGEKGIPWVIVATALISFIVSKIYVNGLRLKINHLSLNTIMADGKPILKSGMYLSLANIINLFSGFLIQLFIVNAGGVDQAGLYNAGFILINSYVAVFFSALSKDYFPRLVEISGDSISVNKTVNEQAYVLLLLITPIIIVFLIFKPFIVSLLFSKEFLPILGMISFGILATAFKAVSWSMGFILIAKGNSRLYLLTEFVSYSCLLLSVIIGYNIGGLTGLGVGYLIYHIFDLVFIKYIVTKKYDFSFNSRFSKLFYLCVFQFIIMLSLFYLENDVIKYGIMALVALFSMAVTLIKLDSHINLREMFKRKFKN